MLEQTLGTLALQLLSFFFFFFFFFFFLFLGLTGVGGVSVFDQQQIHIKPEWHRSDAAVFQYAPSLVQCIRKFDAYVFAQFTQKNKSFCFVTDGPGDLVHVLRKECALKGIRLAAYFDRYFDLGKEFTKFYPEYTGGRTLADMAQCVGVLRRAELPSGMENCKIISNVIASMLGEGYVFVEPEVIPISFDPLAAPLSHSSLQLVSPMFVDSVQQQPPQQQQHLQQQHQHASPPPQQQQQKHQQAQQQQPLQQKVLSYKGAVAGGQPRASAPTGVVGSAPPSSLSGVPIAPGPLANHSVDDSGDESSEPDTPVLRLRGLPWDATEEQLREFFVGLNVVDVMWTFTHRNRPSGEAFVTLSSVSEAVHGLKLHKHVLGKRYIEVFASSPAQAQAAHQQKKLDGPAGGNGGNGGSNSNSNNGNSNSNNSNNNNGTGNGKKERGNEGETMVMIYGLPYTVTVDEIEEFFSGFNFIPGSVEIDTDASGKALGTGQVNFYKAKDATRAIAERNRKFIGKRYVNLHQNAQKRKQQQQQLLNGQK